MLNGYANQMNDMEEFSIVIALMIEHERFGDLHFSRPTNNQYWFLVKYNSCIFLSCSHN